MMLSSPFTQNDKMVKTSQQNNVAVFNFGLPAGLTCPCAGELCRMCYANSGNYRFPSVMEHRMNNYRLSQDKYFTAVIVGELVKLQHKCPDSDIYIRIHDSGDFYDSRYLESWLEIMEMMPEIHFYAYTKSVQMLLDAERADMVPDNFRYVFSYGGTQDILIGDRPNARVFRTLEDMASAGYVNGSDDDLVMFNTDRVGLLYH